MDTVDDSTLNLNMSPNRFPSLRPLSRYRIINSHSRSHVLHHVAIQFAQLNVFDALFLIETLPAPSCRTYTVLPALNCCRIRPKLTRSNERRSVPLIVRQVGARCTTVIILKPSCLQPRN